MKTTITKILLCSALFLCGCADIRFSDEDRKLFLQRNYNTTDVRSYIFEGGSTRRWLVRTRSGEVVYVVMNSTSNKLEIERSDTIFSALRE